MSAPTPLLILGDGAFAVEALDIAEAAGGYAPVGFVNSLEPPQPGAALEGLPIFWVDDIPYGVDACRAIGAMVTNRRRDFVERIAARGYRFATLVHPSASVSKRASLAEGVLVNAGVVVSPNALIGEHTIVNRGALIAHDVRLGAYCTLGPGANLAGSVEVGEGAWIGIGAVVRERHRIGAGAVVAAGAVVVHDVPDNTMVAGVPARVIRTGVNGH